MNVPEVPHSVPQIAPPKSGTEQLAPHLSAGPLFNSTAISDQYQRVMVTEGVGSLTSKGMTVAMHSGEARELLWKWQELFNRQDFDELAALYAEVATLHGTSSGLLHSGRAQIRSYFRGRATVVFGSTHITALGPRLQLASGFYSFEVPGGEDGSSKTLKARFTFVIGSKAVGAAHILHHHSSLCP